MSGQSEFYRGYALRIVAAQVAAGLLVALVTSLLLGWRDGYSALVGSAIGALPSFYLAMRMFRSGAGRSATASLRNIYVAESVKILLTVALFIIALRLLDVNFLVVVLTWVLMTLVHRVALLFPEHRPRPVAD